VTAFLTACKVAIVVKAEKLLRLRPQPEFAARTPFRSGNTPTANKYAMIASK